MLSSIRLARIVNQLASCLYFLPVHQGIYMAHPFVFQRFIFWFVFSHGIICMNVGSCREATPSSNRLPTCEPGVSKRKFYVNNKISMVYIWYIIYIINYEYNFIDSICTFYPSLTNGKRFPDEKLWCIVLIES